MCWSEYRDRWPCAFRWLPLHSLHPSHYVLTKLTGEAVAELLMVAGECEALCPLIQPHLGAIAPRRPTRTSSTTSRRSFRRYLHDHIRLVTPQHLQKKALIYIRQSTPHQQISNQESLRLQYALQERAQSLGWHAEDVEIIDADLGLTGASALHRTGFQELVAKVTLGQVGIILSVDVTRLSRNCSDWYPLLDVCGYRCCLIADNDGIYDPGSAERPLALGTERTTL